MGRVAGWGIRRAVMDEVHSPSPGFGLVRVPYFDNERCEVLNTPAITALFTMIRDKNTDTATYQLYADRLMRILAEEGLARIAMPTIVQTPCGPYKGLRVVPYTEMCTVSIVRSGDIL